MVSSCGLDNRLLPTTTPVTSTSLMQTILAQVLLNLSPVPLSQMLFDPATLHGLRRSIGYASGTFNSLEWTIR